MCASSFGLEFQMILTCIQVCEVLLHPFLPVPSLGTCFSAMQISDPLLSPSVIGDAMRYGLSRPHLGLYTLEGLVLDLEFQNRQGES